MHHDGALLVHMLHVGCVDNCSRLFYWADGMVGSEAFFLGIHVGPPPPAPFNRVYGY